MPKRQSNDTKRRIAPPGEFEEPFFKKVSASSRYGGSPNHKKNWADYGFERPASPRPTKSLCDGIRKLPKAEAEALLARGIERRMVSVHLIGDLPKYVWAVDDDGEPFEAKLGEDGRSYHGYRLEENARAMRQLILKEWKARG